MRLLLDEHYSPKIARALRERGHNVVSVKERDDLRGSSDSELWGAAVSDRRTLVTENVADFAPLIRDAAAAGEPHLGVVFTSARSMPRGAGSIGLYVERLDAFLVAHRAEDALADQTHWLGG